MSYPFARYVYESLPVPEDYVPITLDADIAGDVVGLWVGAAGAVGVQMHDGTARTIPAVPAGTMIWGRFRRVTTAGTGVSNPTTNILAARMLRS